MPREQALKISKLGFGQGKHNAETNLLFQEPVSLLKSTNCGLLIFKISSLSMILLKLLLHFPILQLQLCNLTCQLLPKEKSGFSEMTEKNLSNTITPSEKKRQKKEYYTLVY